jgi:cysteine desulfurase/selenocysteine lyase
VSDAVVRIPATSTAPGYDLDALRAREFAWTLDGAHVYLNNASTGPIPRRSIEASDRVTRARAEPFRVNDAENFATLARARELAARLIGATPAEIALMVNTTYGINLAARALGLAAGDVVVLSDREFPANVYPWMALERDLGVTVRRLPCVDGLPDEPALLRAIADPAVKVVAVSWVQFATGWRADLAAIGRRCRERGVFLVVDAMQGLGAATLDVNACMIDVLACGGQKWLMSPWGTGFTWVRRELVERMAPHAVGWMAVQGSDDFTRLTDYDLTWRDDARRFEVITLPFQDFAGLAASLELIHELGPANIERHVTMLADAIVERASASRSAALVTPADPARRAGIVSIRPADAPLASRRLAAAGVSHSLREGNIRLSPHCYNTLGEIDHALAVLGL